MLLIWALPHRRGHRSHAGKGVQQAVAGREVGGAGPYPLAGDEFEDRATGIPARYFQPHPDRRAQPPAGQTDPDPPGTEEVIVFNRPPHQAVTQAQFAVISGELPARQ